MPFNIKSPNYFMTEIKESLIEFQNTLQDRHMKEMSAEQKREAWKVIRGLDTLIEMISEEDKLMQEHNHKRRQHEALALEENMNKLRAEVANLEAKKEELLKPTLASIFEGLSNEDILSKCSDPFGQEQVADVLHLDSESAKLVENVTVSQVLNGGWRRLSENIKGE